MDLLELRKEIDEIDAQIVELFEKRMKIAEDVAAYKMESGKRVFDKVREKEKLQKIASMASNDFNRAGLKEIFEQIMSMSRKLQYKLLTRDGRGGRLPFIAIDGVDKENITVVYQGTKGAYAELATKSYFGKDVRLMHLSTWRECMEAIEDGSADYAVLPIDNSTAGAVDQVYSLLDEFENYIVAEQLITIKHSLFSVPGADIASIKRVYSHPQALMQSQRFLEEHPYMEQITTTNTAIAAEKIMKDKDPEQAAIASSAAGELYGLVPLAEGINMSEMNATRFIIVTNQKVFTKDADKITLCFELPHYSGSLYRMLSHFIYNEINMTKIESRPVEDRSWEYKFFVDIEGNLADPAVKNAIRGLREEARNLKILGNYKSSN